MNAAARRSPLAMALLASAVALAPACGGSTDTRPAQRDAGRLQAGQAVVQGTTLDAASRRPLAGVAVRGPGGASTVSDERGRFVLRGLTVGAEGELVAEAKDGRRAVNRLRPLRNERLEVVLHLRRP